MLPKSFENLGRELRDSVLRLLRDYSEALFLAILMAVILRLFVISAYKISNSTMEPNLKLGDFIIGYKLPYGIDIPFSEKRIGKTVPARGEIIIFKCPKNLNQFCVKRVIGLPGDRVEIRGKRLIVNGRAYKYLKSVDVPTPSFSTPNAIAILKESQKGQPPRNIIVSNVKETNDFGPYIVPPDAFFALGDNRDFSEDSRHWGAIPLASIESRALFVWLSIEWQKKPSGAYSSSVRWRRMLKVF